ncbi:NADH dehydrogenase I, L subunit [Geotalea daltonii FRC-32]|uniref:NADH dehydrogenase I, L subunit n=1 Tax=Geotalea daltonii (strain DSM 22248 / JCM 15807 / FRC-32) TaxID=316067 RepID=B9M3Z0_GEODF|nr:NADH-quinone oxidoreductase subunit L [Geotalea daltonii]ACM19633.1 NADH dehydrogenase I, L subunit [Geotalea daltonii FRC-32]
MKLYLALIILLPLIGGIINAVVGSKLPRRISELLACGVVWGSFVCSLLAYGAYQTPTTVKLASWLAAFDFEAPISLYLDPLALVMVLMITFVCGLIHVYSVGYMAGDPDYVRYFALLNLFVFAMLVLVLAENLPLLYLGWEGVGFCSYALIGFWYREEKNATAGRKAFIVTRIGDTAFGIAIFWMFQLFHTVSITELNGLGFLMPVGVITALGLLLLFGAMGKSAQLPLMVWLPDAMAGPTPVSAQIHAATMVTAGVYLLARMFPLIGMSTTVQAAIALTGALTAFYAATCALAQRDLKRILAYSTISQIGYMMLGVGCGAISAATFHLLVHAFFKALLFLAAGCVIATMHHEQDIFRMGGLRSRLPLTFWPFLAGAACLAGIPLTGGFFSKDSILLAAWEKGGTLYGGLYILGLVTALITSIYTFRMVYLVFGGSTHHLPPLEKGGTGGIYSAVSHKIPLYPPLSKGEGFVQPPRVMELMLIPLAILALCGGLLNLPAYLGPGWLEDFLSGTVSKESAGAGHAIELVLQAVATVAALAGLAVAHMRYGKRRDRVIAAAAQPESGLNAFLLRGWYADDLYRLLFVRPYKALAGILWQRIDEGVIDDALDRLAEILGRVGRDVGCWTTGQVSLYIISFAAGGALILGYLAWVVW